MASVDPVNYIGRAMFPLNFDIWRIMSDERWTPHPPLPEGDAKLRSFLLQGLPPRAGRHLDCICIMFSSPSYRRRWRRQTRATLREAEKELRPAVAAVLARSAQDASLPEDGKVLFDGYVHLVWLILGPILDALIGMVKTELERAEWAEQPPHKLEVATNA